MYVFTANSKPRWSMVYVGSFNSLWSPRWWGLRSFRWTRLRPITQKADLHAHVSVTHVEGLSPSSGPQTQTDRMRKMSSARAVREMRWEARVQRSSVFEASCYACNPCGDGGGTRAFLIPSCEEDLHDQSELLQTVSPCNDVTALLSNILYFNLKL